LDSHLTFHPPSNVGIQLSASVATHLREQIISGALKTGDFLRIDAIAAELRVSTTPVREGLLLLQSESFVRLLPRRGFVVNSFNKEDLRDIFWAQAIIGAELAARAARTMTKDDHARLQQLIADHEKSFANGDSDNVARLGHKFHRAINLAANSPRLALLLGSLTKQLPNRFYASIEGQLEETFEYHPIILDAIRVKDSDAVRSLMYRHIMSGGDHLVESLERTGAWGPPQEGANAPTVAPPAKAARKPTASSARPAPQVLQPATQKPRSGRTAIPPKAIAARRR
jgi:DNA-binding GntR family transcriptional regulator